MEKSSSFLQSIENFFDSVEKLTDVQKILICVSSFVLLIGAFTYFLHLPKLKKIDAYKKEYKNLSKRLDTAKKNARDLNKYKNKLNKKKIQFNIVMKALPEKKEIPQLVSSISQAGLDAGLEFVLFQPKSEKQKDFYAEIPISIKVNGSYHNIAVFFDKVSRLNRIVNIEDIKISSSKSKTDGKLNTSCTAITYKFIERKKSVNKKKRK